MPKDQKKKKRFFKDFKAELKKVIWPTQKQLVNKTVAVVIIVIVVAVIVLALDFVFEKANEYGDKVKSKIITQSTQNVTNEESANLTEETENSSENVETTEDAVGNGETTNSAE